MGTVEQTVALIWDGHSSEIIALLGVALAFLVLSRAVHHHCSRSFKTGDDAAIATYRIVGLVHHTLQVPLALWALSDRRLWQDRLYSHTELSTLVIVISSGYFVYDFFHCIYNIKVQGVAYILHGAGCASVYLFSLLQVPTMLHFYGAGFLMWEFSSFAVHARWFLFKLKANSKLQLLNGLILLLSFLFARIVWGFYLSYMFWTDILKYLATSPHFVYMTLASNTALNALNTYWFVLILGKAIGQLSGKKRDSIGKRD